MIEGLRHKNELTLLHVHDVRGGWLHYESYLDSLRDPFINICKFRITCPPEQG